ncbi:heavy-metal-associated domain-containing protein, partial [Myxococcota bacterium]|nr:heavy-metal-associated domain-containing protein [Myxococcota bacterium]
MDVQPVSLSIEGMTCAACSGRLERLLQGREGVASAHVNLAAETATIASALDSAALIEIIERAG